MYSKTGATCLVNITRANARAGARAYGTIYAHKFPQHHADSSANGKALGFSRPTSSNYIKSMKHGTESDTPQNDVRSYAYPSDVSGSETTYYGDYCYYNSSGVVLYCGGSWDSAGKAGLWYLYGYYAASASSSSVGARLSFRPL